MRLSSIYGLRGDGAKHLLIHFHLFKLFTPVESALQKFYQKGRGTFANCTRGIASGMPIPSDHSPEGTNRAPSEDSAEDIG
jgi:hypothetical protein